MFKKLLTLIAVLCMSATAMAAPPQIGIDESTIRFYTEVDPNGGGYGVPGPVGKFSFEVKLLDLGDFPLADVAIAFDIGVQVLNAGMTAQHAAINYDADYDNDGTPGYVSANEQMWRFADYEVDPLNPTSWQAVTSGNYAFAPFSSNPYVTGLAVSNSRHNGGPTNIVGEEFLLTKGISDGAVEGAGFKGAMPAVGDTVAMFIMDWDGTDVSTAGNAMVLHLQGGSALPDPFFLTNDNDKVICEIVGQDLLIPEPATMGLLGLGLVGLVIRRKK